MCNKLFLFFSVILYACPLQSIASSEFDAYLKSQASQYKDDSVDFEQHRIKQEKEFQLYRDTVLKQFNNYKQKISKLWGKKNAPITVKNKWVEYSNELKSRHIVDFENGNVDVEVVVNKSDVKKSLEEAIIRTVTTGADNRSLKSTSQSPEAKTKVKTSTKPLLEGQVINHSGKPVTSSNAKQFAAQTLSKPYETYTTKGTDGRARTIAKVQFKLIPRHIKVRAQKFKLPVNSYAKQYKIPKNLVYSVIETESFFNPVARSYVPAFGLMQLVPHYGAREAYRFVYNRDKILSDRYLYNPDNNIRLGSAYLHVLYYKHFSDITNTDSRLWATIAAYNTGPTNVMRAIIGKYSRSKYRRYSIWKRKAIQAINKLNSEQLYKKLRSNLPFKETRNYLLKVRHRMPKYTSL